ncbi:nucleotide pyrophosphohydrolase [Microbulbifer guangxiensis]|uniref:nucleotide pyrophosphohydrolase n=1 Tax=Microbulbifer guangxiensis TaxID=2904249 RepID=UPI001F1C928B|nr:nucleotide pyrophosphohydrolase [Microbulbifer guangxiensis]
MESQQILDAFDEVATRRGWSHHHTPKNLCMALSVEVAELTRHFQWRSDDEIKALLRSEEGGAVATELADIQMYLLKLAATLGVDLEAAVASKIAENRRRCEVVEGSDDRGPD